MESILFQVQDKSIDQIFLIFFVLKAYVYADKPASIEALKVNTEAFIREIPAEMLERACQI